MVLFNSRFVGFVFLSTFDELRVYKAELEHMQWLLKMICRFRYWWNKLKWTVVWGKCQKCKLYLCMMPSFFQAAVSSISRVQFTIERVYKRSRKTKLGDLSEITYQKRSIFDKNFFIKAQKNSIIFKVLGTEGIRLQDLKQNSVIRVQVFLAESIWMAFDAWTKNYYESLCLILLPPNY